MSVSVVVHIYIYIYIYIYFFHCCELIEFLCIDGNNICLIVVVDMHQLVLNLCRCGGKYRVLGILATLGQPTLNTYNTHVGKYYATME